MSWLTSLHSARRRLPTRLSWKNSSYSDNCGLAIQSDYKNTKIYWEKTRNGRKYKRHGTKLRLFKPNCFNISEILYKQMLFLYNFCMFLSNILKVPMKYNFDWQRRTTSMPTGVLSYFMGCITVEVLSFFVFWWTECICLSICKSQDNPFLYHTILVQSFARDGSSEIFCSLIFCRGRHCRQVRQGVVSPCHTCGT